MDAVDSVSSLIAGKSQALLEQNGAAERKKNHNRSKCGQMVKGIRG
jgi:hypothetical protein